MSYANPFGWRNDRWLQNVQMPLEGNIRVSVGPRPGQEGTPEEVRGTWWTRPGTVNVRPMTQPDWMTRPPGHRETNRVSPK